MATLVPTYDPSLARVTLTISGLDAATASTVVTRWTGPTTSAVVRGSDLGASTSGIVHDYEFESGVTTVYIVEAFDADGDPVDATGSEITPTLDAVWLKSIARPFLNRAVTVTGFSDVSLPARGGVLDVLDRRLPVAVTGVRGSRRYTLEMTTETLEQAEALELFFSFGDPVFVHVPGGCVVPRSMYAFAGDVSISRRGAHDTERRYFAVPLTEIAAPDPTIVGYTVTWGGVVSGFATWDDVTTDFPTWLDVLQYVADPADEVVS